MIQLPESLEERLIEAVKDIEEELKMPYINTVEQYGIKQGIAQGIKQGIEQGRLETVRQLLALGALTLTDEQIVQTFKLSAKEVAQLRLGNKH